MIRIDSKEAINNFNSFTIKENNELSTSQAISPKEGDKVKLLLFLEDLSKKKNNLLSMLQSIQKSVNEIEEQEKEIKTRLELMEVSENREQQKQIVGLPMRTVEEQKKESVIEKITQVAHSILVINNTQIIKSQDSSGEREHYSVSLISKKNKKIEINKWPVNISKYGMIKQIKVFDGKNETVLENDIPAINRLITYLSSDFNAFRKKINTVDKNGSYSNKYQSFDCQRFSYYLQHGTEGTYGYRLPSILNKNYKNELEQHVPGRFYSIKAQTADFGKNGTYNQKDMAVHHFMYLTNDVYVSKYGASEVLFTSYKHILDSYFPEKFVKGIFSEEIW
jgi:hypothetical protein